MIEEYFIYKEHPDTIRHKGGVLEVPPHVTTADIEVRQWCSNYPCKYTVKAPLKIGVKCPVCGEGDVGPLPF